MLKAMGRELASIHLGNGDNGNAIIEDLNDRGQDGAWLEQASATAADVVRKEWLSFKESNAE
jgi:hypothetical protein